MISPKIGIYVTYVLTRLYLGMFMNIHEHVCLYVCMCTDICKLMKDMVMNLKKNGAGYMGALGGHRKTKKCFK